MFILRATTNSFPGAYREDLFEFPQALRDALTATEGDAKELHNQEERRLFYVGMTRARDTLAIYGKRSRSKKDRASATVSRRHISWIHQRFRYGTTAH